METKNVFEHPLNQSEEFQEAFASFLKMRKSIRKPASERAITLLLKKVIKMSDGKESLAIEIIDQANINGWMDFYPLKEENTSYGATPQPKKREEL